MMNKENKSKTRTLSVYYKNAVIIVKKRAWKRRRFIKPICSTVVYKDGKYEIYLTLEKHGEICYISIDNNEWPYIAEKADKYFAKKLCRLI